MMQIETQLVDTLRNYKKAGVVKAKVQGFADPDYLLYRAELRDYANKNNYLILTQQVGKEALFM